MTTAMKKREPNGIHTWFRPRPLETVRDEIHDLFSRAFGNDVDMWGLDRMTPSLDLAETGDALEIRMDIPGMEGKDINIHVSDHVLTINGERKEDREEKGKTWHRVERRSGSFSRSLTLPCHVKEDAVEAHYNNGILVVRLPKAEEAKARKVPVKT
jgi:HSP20 family protein